MIIGNAEVSASSRCQKKMRQRSVKVFLALLKNKYHISKNRFDLMLSRGSGFESESGSGSGTGSRTGSTRLGRPSLSPRCSSEPCVASGLGASPPDSA